MENSKELTLPDGEERQKVNFIDFLKETYLIQIKNFAGKINEILLNRVESAVISANISMELVNQVPLYYKAFFIYSFLYSFILKDVFVNKKQIDIMSFLGFGSAAGFAAIANGITNKGSLTYDANTIYAYSAVFGTLLNEYQIKKDKFENFGDFLINKAIELIYGFQDNIIGATITNFATRSEAIVAFANMPGGYQSGLFYFICYLSTIKTAWFDKKHINKLSFTGFSINGFLAWLGNGGFGNIGGTAYLINGALASGTVFAGFKNDYANYVKNNEK